MCSSSNVRRTQFESQPASRFGAAVRRFVLIAVVSCLATPSVSWSAEIIRDEQLRFTLKLPEGFQPMDAPPPKPDIIYMFSLGEPEQLDELVVLRIERMRAMLPNEPLDASLLPADRQVTIFTLPWKQFEINGVEFSQDVEGLTFVNLNVQVPLAPKAIQLNLAGAISRREELFALMRELLGGLEGETNWNSATSPESLFSWKFRLTLLGISIGAGAIAAVVVARLTRHARREMLLIIGTIVMVGASGGHAQLAIGSDPKQFIFDQTVYLALQVAGLIGFIWGIVRVVRRRDADQKPALVNTADSPTRKPPIKSDATDLSEANEE